MNTETYLIVAAILGVIALWFYINNREAVDPFGGKTAWHAHGDYVYQPEEEDDEGEVLVAVLDEEEELE